MCIYIYRERKRKRERLFDRCSPHDVNGTFIGSITLVLISPFVIRII